MQFGLGVVILAAGASSRMGRPKMVLPWGSTSVLGHIIKNWFQLTSQVAVVIPPGKNAIESELDRLGFPVVNRIVNPAPENGMFSSIECAARWNGWNRGLSHYAVALGDQPQISFRTLEQLRDFAAANPASICQPSRNGRAKHPLIFPRVAFEQLRHCGFPMLRGFFEASSFPRALLPSDDPSLDFDLDTPEDYSLAMSRFPGGFSAHEGEKTDPDQPKNS